MGTGTLERGTLGVIVGKKKPSKINPHDKKMISLKMSGAARNMVETLSGEMGVDKTAVIELAVRKLYEQEYLLKSKKNPN